MESVEEQVRVQIRNMRIEALQSLQLAQDIEDSMAEDGDIGFITDGDELVGFSFPQEVAVTKEG